MRERVSGKEVLEERRRRFYYLVSLSLSGSVQDCGKENQILIRKFYSGETGEAKVS